MCCCPVSLFQPTDAHHPPRTSVALSCLFIFLLLLSLPTSSNGRTAENVYSTPGCRIPSVSGKTSVIERWDIVAATAGPSRKEKKIDIEFITGHYALRVSFLSTTTLFIAQPSFTAQLVSLLLCVFFFPLSLFRSTGTCFISASCAQDDAVDRPAATFVLFPTIVVLMLRAAPIG